MQKRLPVPGGSAEPGKSSRKSCRRTRNDELTWQRENLCNADPRRSIIPTRIPAHEIFPNKQEVTVLYYKARQVDNAREYLRFPGRLLVKTESFPFNAVNLPDFLLREPHF